MAKSQMAKAQTAKTGPSARPPSRRPATRESRPALIGLAVILIVGDAFASAWLAIQSGRRSYFLQVDEEVTRGAPISDAEGRKVSLSEYFWGGIAAGEGDVVV